MIGVTARRLTVDGRALDGAEHEYAEAIARAGGLPCLLPMVGEHDGEAWLDRIDGLLLTGGGDIAPCRYGKAPSASVGGVDVDRDGYESPLVVGALERALPILGICRGCQMINVATGGSLHQHLPDITDQPHLVLGPRDQLAHDVEVEPDSQLAAALGTERTSVNSIHHQAIDRCGDVMRAVAWSADGMIEGIECRRGPALGVQWHPEHLVTAPSQQALFRWLVQQAMVHAADRSTSPDMGSAPEGMVDHG